MSERQGRRIVALVLTHNAPHSLARCLAAIDAQTEAPEEIVVVDNASQPAVRASSLSCDRRSLRIIRSDVNGGPAGGWAIALRHFLASDFTHAWVMDDDIVPEPTCLATLWGTASDDPTSAFLFPIAIQPDGAVGRWGSWCGFLVSREIVARVGLPMEALFWWAEDAEYCEWRIPEPVFPVASSTRPWCTTMPSVRGGTSRSGSTTTSPAIRCTTTFTSCTGWAAFRRSSPA